MTHVSEVNGPDSAEVLNFAPTRYELIQLVKHWATWVTGYRFDLFLYRVTSSARIRREAFACDRVIRMTTVLGAEAVEEAIDDAEEEFSETVSPRVWWIFKNGTKERWEAFLDEVDEDLRSLNQKGEKQKGADGR
jgi:hypothetical protein